MNKRILFAVLGCTLFSLPALCDTRSDVLAAMQRCGVLADDRTWLECTYGAQQLMRAKLGLQPAPDYQQRLVPPPSMTPAPMPSVATTEPRTTAAPLPHSNPSFLQILTGSAKPVAVSALASIEYDKQGAFIATLENGQVWRQVNVESGSKARLKPGTKVTITPGALGSFNLKADKRAYKVEQAS